MNHYFQVFFFSLASIFAFSIAEHAQAQIDTKGYFIGNSLSWDMLKSGGLEEIASSVGSGKVIASQHIQCSTPLTGIIQSWIDDPNGDRTCTSSRSTTGENFDLGVYNGVFDEPIDYLVLQPFQNATLREEIASTKTIIDQFRANPQNDNARVLIYQTWDLRRSTESYLADWNTRTVGMDTEFRPSKNAYDQFFAELSSDGYEYEVIPVGQAFADLSEVLKNETEFGNIDDTNDLFRDFIHGSNSGRYFADLVAARVLTGESVLNVADASEFTAFGLGGHGGSANSDASLRLRQIAELSVVGVPEPSGFGFLLIASLGFVMRRRRISK